MLCDNSFECIDVMKASENEEVNEVPLKNIFSCVMCDQSFETFNELRRHKRSHSEKPFSCSKCEKAFKSFSDLIVHKRTHEIVTEEVSVQGSNEQEASSQEQTHTNAKPFNCTIGDKKFTSSLICLFYTHSRIIH